MLKNVSVVKDYVFSGTLYRSGDLSAHFFDDWRSNASGDDANTCFEGNRGIEVVVLYDSQEHKEQPYFTQEQLNNLTIEELVRYHNFLCGTYSEQQVTAHYTPNEVIDDLVEVTTENFYINMYNELLFTEFKEDYVSYAVHGYSQGDVVYVVDLRQVYVQDTDNDRSEYLQHLLYDVPLSGTIDVYDVKTGKHIDELPFFEWLDDEYAYDSTVREAILVKVQALDVNKYPYRDELLVYLGDTLPLDYSDIQYID